MDRQKINRICMQAPLLLSWTAFVWTMGNVTGAAGRPPATDEGTGFFVFWLLILVQAPFVLGFIATTDWGGRRGPAGLAFQAAAIVLAFSPVFYFRL